MGSELRCHIEVLCGSIILLFGFGRRDVADGFEQATMVEPVDPFERVVLDGFEAAPRPASMDHLRFVEAVDRLGQSVVVAVSNAANRWLYPGFGEALGVLDRHVLRSAVAMMDEAAPMGRPVGMESLLQGIEDEAGMRRSTRPPPHDPPGVGVYDEGDVDEARPGRDVGEIDTHSMFGAGA